MEFEEIVEDIDASDVVDNILGNKAEATETEAKTE